MSRIAVRYNGQVTEFERVFVDFHPEIPLGAPYIYFHEEDHHPEIDVTVENTIAGVEAHFRSARVASVDIGDGRVLRQLVASVKEEGFDLVLECTTPFLDISEIRENPPLGSWHWN